jgi:nicotinamide riboside transporter PnuC
MTFLSWILTAIALYGTWLNSNLEREGFYFWLISNAGFVVTNIYSEQYALSFLFSVNALLALRGIRNWDSQKREKL